MISERHPSAYHSHARAVARRRIRRRVLVLELVVGALATAFVLATGTALSSLAATLADAVYSQGERS